MASSTKKSVPRESLPAPEIRNEIVAQLSDLIRSIESHGRWTPPNPHRSLLNIWDFVQRTRYIMSELDNIEAGRPLRYPEQIPDLLGAGKLKKNQDPPGTGSEHPRPVWPHPGGARLTPGPRFSRPPRTAKTGTAAALECFTDVYTRSLNVDLLLSDPVRQRSTCHTPGCPLSESRRVCFASMRLANHHLLREK